MSKAPLFGMPDFILVSLVPAPSSPSSSLSEDLPSLSSSDADRDNEEVLSMDTSTPLSNGKSFSPSAKAMYTTFGYVLRVSRTAL